MKANLLIFLGVIGFGLMGQGVTAAIAEKPNANLSLRSWIKPAVPPKVPGRVTNGIFFCKCGDCDSGTYFHTSSADVDCTNACKTRATAWGCGNCSSAGQDCLDPAK